VPALPDDLREELARLARFGNATGCRQALARAAEQRPDLAPRLQALDELARRFDFAALLHRLRADASTPHAADSSEQAE
jgi:hypothetical protein